MRSLIRRHPPARLWTLALAVYFIALELSLLPFASELYSARGVVPSERFWSWMGDGATIAIALQALRVALATLLLAPRFFVVAALGLWLTRVLQLQINPFTLAPQEPVLLVLLALAPALRSRGGFARPPECLFAARLALALSLFAAGWSKVSGPSDASWLNGSALYWILRTSPLATDFGAWAAARAPASAFALPSYLLLATELLAPLLLFGRRTRRFWAALALPAFAMGPLFLDLASVFAGLLLAIAFALDAQSASPSGTSEASTPTIS